MTCAATRLVLLISILVVVFCAGGCDDDESCPSCPPACASPILVRPDGTGDYATIQAAIDAADSAAVVELADGTFTGDGNRDLSYQGKAITVRSQGGNPEACTIDCEGSESDMHYGFQFDNDEVPASQLEGVTIRGGYYFGGAGIGCSNASPTILNCIFEENHASQFAGGALHCNAGAPNISGCLFARNSAPVGGAISSSHASPLIENCIFEADSADGAGGAFASQHGSPTLRNCTFSANHAGEAGGAIRSYYDSGAIFENLTITGNSAGAGGGGMSLEDVTLAIIQGCWLSGNSAGSGGGLGIAGSVTLVHSTITKNIAEAMGGGLVYVGGSLAIANCTFYGNEAGGLLCNGSDPVSIARTIIAFNEGHAIQCFNDPQITISCSDIYGNPGGDWTDCIADHASLLANTSLDPLFCDPEAGVLTLRYISPCVNDSCGVIGAWPEACD